MPHADSPILTARAQARAGQWGEVLHLLNTTVDPTSESERVALIAEAYLRTQRPSLAEVWLRNTLPDVERGSDAVARRRAVNMFGVALFELGKLDEAEPAFQRAVELGVLDDDPLLIARATNNLGQIANVRGERANALALYQLAVPAYQQLGHTLGLAETYHNMAISYLYLNDLTQADEAERQAMEFARTVPTARLAALARIGRAEIALRRGDTEAAYVTAFRGTVECRGLNEQAGATDGLRVMALASMARGETDNAAKALDDALSLAAYCANPVLMADVLRAYAELDARRRAVEDMRKHATAALDLYERVGAASDRAALQAWLNEATAG